MANAALVFPFCFTRSRIARLVPPSRLPPSLFSLLEFSFLFPSPPLFFSLFPFLFYFGSSTMNIRGKNEFMRREKHSLVLYSVIAFRMHRFVDSLIRRPFDFNSISTRAWRVCLAFGNRPCTNLIDFGARYARKKKKEEKKMKNKKEE